MRRAATVALLALAFEPEAAAGEIPGAILVLEVHSAGPPGHVPEAAPPRFVLLEDGQVFVGGTSQVAVGRLERKEAKPIEARLAKVRKLPGLGSSVTLGPGARRHRLLLRKGRPLEIVATGDPAAAPPALKPLADLLRDLLAFDHPSLRPYRPSSFLLRAREGTLPGGCRAWGFAVPPREVLAVGRTVTAAEAQGWPTGAVAASVCVADKNYVVTLRPLLPGEKP